MELLVVLTIFGILGGLSFSAFGGLQNTIKMNEYVLTLEQDIRSVQRSTMLLQRDSGEKWLYGLGIDFGDMNVNHDGAYSVFKWCSPFSDYGDILTRSNLPGYNPSTSYPLGSTLPGYTSERNGYMNVFSGIESNCDTGITSSLSLLSGYDKSTTTPKSTITITAIDGKTPRYLVFESVSGRAFFYDNEGALLNYTSEGKLVETPQAFVITIIPASDVSSRVITIGNLSGKIEASILQ